MPEFTSGTLLFYSGIIGMSLAVVSSIVAIIILRISSKRIKGRLEEEFGKKKR